MSNAVMTIIHKCGETFGSILFLQNTGEGNSEYGDKKVLAYYETPVWLFLKKEADQLVSALHNFNEEEKMALSYDIVRNVYFSLVHTSLLDTVFVNTPKGICNQTTLARLNAVKVTNSLIAPSIYSLQEPSSLSTKEINTLTYIAPEYRKHFGHLSRDLKWQIFLGCLTINRHKDPDINAGEHTVAMSCIINNNSKSFEEKITNPAQFEYLLYSITLKMLDQGFKDNTFSPTRVSL
jgi:hypothetical protein